MSVKVDYSILNQKGTPAFFSDILSNRPAAGFAGRVFISTDSGQIFEDNGTSWVLIADAGVGGGTLSSVCLNGNTTATGIVITAGGLSSNSLTDTALTSGSVLFATSGGTISQDNSNLFWDNTNKWLGIGTAPSSPLDIHSSAAASMLALNNTGGNASNIIFLNASANKWRIGNTSSNTFDLFNNQIGTTALSFSGSNSAATFINSVTATSFIKTGGTSSQFLKADGSVDSNSYITLASLSATSPVQYNNTTGIISILQAGASQSGYLSSTDWNTFNNKAGLGSFSASSPLSYNNSTGAFSIQVANSGQSGYLTNTDWNTFNNKQTALTFGNLTETVSSVLTITGGTNAVIGTGTTIQIKQSSNTQSGYLSSTDWNTFNNKATALNGTGFVKASGTTITYDNSTYYLASNPSNFITLSSLAATAPLAYNNTSGGFSITQADASSNGYLSSTDWNTFNNKQSALTNPVTGTGTNNTIAKFNSTGSTIGNSNITDDGTLITLAGTRSLVSGLFRIGSDATQVYQNFVLNKNLTGGTSTYGFAHFGTIQSDVTSVVYGNISSLNTAAAAFTLGTLYHYHANGVVIGSGSAVTTQVGFYVPSGFTTATNNYAFRSQIASGGGWNIYMDGTASNYMAGSLGIGSTTLTGLSLAVTKNITGATTSYGIVSNGTAQSDVTTQAIFFGTVAKTQATTYTLSSLHHFSASQGTFGAGSTITNQRGFYVESSLTGATNNYGFYGDIASGTNRWNLYMNGTASNYLNGTTLIGTTTDNGAKFQVNGTSTFSGNVGIGTTSPSSGKLQIDLDGTTGPALFIKNTNTGVADNYAATIAFNADNGTTNKSTISMIRNGYDEFRFSNLISTGITTFYTNATERMRITSGGNVLIGTTSDNGNKLQVNGNISASNVLSGTYTPTLTNNSNITSSTAYQCQYMRVGNVVTVSGQVDITATSALTLTQLIMTLPISSNFPASGFNYCGGTAYFQNGSAFATGYINANQSSTTVSLVYRTGATTPTSQFFFSFTYQIV